ncbi:uncharacterized protein LOC144358561 [Saccoglossus kowalevskii]
MTDNEKDYENINSSSTMAVALMRKYCDYSKDRTSYEMYRSEVRDNCIKKTNATRLSTSPPEIDITNVDGSSVANALHQYLTRSQPTEGDSQWISFSKEIWEILKRLFSDLEFVSANYELSCWMVEVGKNGHLRYCQGIADAVVKDHHDYAILQFETMDSIMEYYDRGMLFTRHFLRGVLLARLLQVQQHLNYLPGIFIVPIQLYPATIRPCYWKVVPNALTQRMAEFEWYKERPEPRINIVRLDPTLFSPEAVQLCKAKKLVNLSKVKLHDLFKENTTLGHLESVFGLLPTKLREGEAPTPLVRSKAWIGNKPSPSVVRNVELIKEKHTDNNAEELNYDKSEKEDFFKLKNVPINTVNGAWHKHDTDHPPTTTTDMCKEPAAEIASDNPMEQINKKDTSKVELSQAKPAVHDKPIQEQLKLSTEQLIKQQRQPTPLIKMEVPQKDNKTDINDADIISSIVLTKFKDGQHGEDSFSDGEEIESPSSSSSSSSSSAASSPVMERKHELPIPHGTAHFESTSSEKKNHQLIDMNVVENNERSQEIEIDEVGTVVLPVQLSTPPNLDIYDSQSEISSSSSSEVVTIALKRPTSPPPPPPLVSHRMDAESISSESSSPPEIWKTSDHMIYAEQTLVPPSCPPPPPPTDEEQIQLTYSTEPSIQVQKVEQDEYHVIPSSPPSSPPPSPPAVDVIVEKIENVCVKKADISETDSSHSSCPPSPCASVQGDIEHQSISEGLPLLPAIVKESDTSYSDSDGDSSHSSKSAPPLPPSSPPPPPNTSSHILLEDIADKDEHEILPSMANKTSDIMSSPPPSPPLPPPPTHEELSYVEEYEKPFRSSTTSPPPLPPPPINEEIQNSLGGDVSTAEVADTTNYYAVVYKDELTKQDHLKADTVSECSSQNVVEEGTCQMEENMLEAITNNVVLAYQNQKESAPESGIENGNDTIYKTDALEMLQSSTPMAQTEKNVKAKNQDDDEDIFINKSIDLSNISETWVAEEEADALDTSHKLQRSLSDGAVIHAVLQKDKCTTPSTIEEDDERTHSMIEFGHSNISSIDNFTFDTNDNDKLKDTKHPDESVIIYSIGSDSSVDTSHISPVGKAEVVPMTKSKPESKAIEPKSQQVNPGKKTVPSKQKETQNTPKAPQVKRQQQQQQQQRRRPPPPPQQHKPRDTSGSQTPKKKKLGVFNFLIEGPSQRNKQQEAAEKERKKKEKEAAKRAKKEKEAEKKKKKESPANSGKKKGKEKGSKDEKRKMDKSDIQIVPSSEDKVTSETEADTYVAKQVEKLEKTKSSEPEEHTDEPNVLVPERVESIERMAKNGDDEKLTPRSRGKAKLYVLPGTHQDIPKKIHKEEAKQLMAAASEERLHESDEYIPTFEKPSERDPEPRYDVVFPEKEHTTKEAAPVIVTDFPIDTNENDHSDTLDSTALDKHDHPEYLQKHEDHSTNVKTDPDISLDDRHLDDQPNDADTHRNPTFTSMRYDDTDRESEFSYYSQAVQSSRPRQTPHADSRHNQKGRLQKGSSEPSVSRSGRDEVARRNQLSQKGRRTYNRNNRHSFAFGDDVSGTGGVRKRSGQSKNFMMNRHRLESKSRSQQNIEIEPIKVKDFHM